MGTKKDIGEVFKQSLNGYTATPDDIWGNIEAQLKRNQRRKFLFFWLLGLFVFIPASYVFYQYNISSPEIENLQKNAVESPSQNEFNPSNPLVTNDSLQQKLNDSITVTLLKKRHINIESQKDTKNIISKRNTGINPKATLDSISKRMKVRNYSFARLPVNIKELQTDSLELTFKDFSQNLIKKDTLPENEAYHGTIFKRWSLSTYTALDHYNAFGRETSNQFTFNQGVFIQYRGTRKIAFRLGHKKLNLQYNFSDINGERQQKLSYTEIPLAVKYSLNNESRLKPSFILGTSFLFLQEATISSTINNTVNSNKNIFRRQLFSLNAGLGLQYRISKRWSVNAESSFNFHPYPYTSSVNFYPYTISINAGIEYHFKF